MVPTPSGKHIVSVTDVGMTAAGGGGCATIYFVVWRARIRVSGYI